MDSMHGTIAPRCPWDRWPQHSVPIASHPASKDEIGRCVSMRSAPANSEELGARRPLSREQTHPWGSIFHHPSA